MAKLSDLKVKPFTDGADKARILDMAKQDWIAGFTINPSLLKKAAARAWRQIGGRTFARRGEILPRGL
jgi:transaldolase